MLKRGLYVTAVYFMLTLLIGATPIPVDSAFALRIPTTGTLQATPSFAIFGVDTTVTVTGSGWVTFPEECRYDLLFDGVKKAQQGPDLGLFTQPSMSFVVLGTTSVGTHTITVVLVGIPTGRTLSTDISFVVSIPLPPGLNELPPGIERLIREGKIPPGLLEAHEVRSVFGEGACRMGKFGFCVSIDCKKRCPEDTGCPCTPISPWSVFVFLVLICVTSIARYMRIKNLPTSQM